MRLTRAAHTSLLAKLLRQIASFLRDRPLMLRVFLKHQFFQICVPFLVMLGISFTIRMENAKFDHPDEYGVVDHVITEMRGVAEIFGMRLPARYHPDPLPPLNYRGIRLTLADKAEMATRLDGALLEGDGWTRHRNRKVDAIALRPDIAECLRPPMPDCYTAAKHNQGWLFVRDGVRIGVHLDYRRRIGDRDDWIRTDHRQWRVLAPKPSERHYPKSDWRYIGAWHGFKVHQMPVLGGSSSFLEVSAERDGRLTMHILTDARLPDVKAWMQTLDLEFLRVMIASPAHGPRRIASNG